MNSREVGLDFDVHDLAATIHAVDWIHTVGTVEGAVLRVLGQLWQLKLHGTAALAAALLGLFAFWLCHEWCLLFLKFEPTGDGQNRRIKGP